MPTFRPFTTLDPNPTQVQLICVEHDRLLFKLRDALREFETVFGDLAELHDEGQLTGSPETTAMEATCPGVAYRFDLMNHVNSEMHAVLSRLETVLEDDEFPASPDPIGRPRTQDNDAPFGHVDSHGRCVVGYPYTSWISQATRDCEGPGDWDLGLTDDNDGRQG